jgi:hypothetical protein
MRAQGASGDDAPVRLPGQPGLQILDLLGEAFSGRIGIGVEGHRGAHVGAGRTAHAQVDAARGQGVEHTELLGHLQGRVVGQHDPGAAQADALGACGDGRQQDLGGRAHDGGQAVVFAHPEAVVAQGFAMGRQVERVAQGGVFAGTGQRNGLVEDGQLHGGIVGRMGPACRWQGQRADRAFTWPAVP